MGVERGVPRASNGAFKYRVVIMGRWYRVEISSIASHVAPLWLVRACLVCKTNIPHLLNIRFPISIRRATKSF